MRPLVIFLIFFFHSLSQASDSKIDLLKNQLTQVSNSELAKKIELYYLLGIDLEKQKEFGQALQYADSCYFLAQSTNNKKYTILSNRIKGRIYQEKDLPDIAANLFAETIDLLNDNFSSITESEKFLMELYLDYSSSLSSLGKYEESDKYIFHALDYFHEKNDSSNIATAFHYIGSSYGRRENFLKAVEFNEKAIRFSKDSSKLIPIYQNIAVGFRRQDSLELARKYLAKGMALCEAASDSTELISLKGILATIYDLEKKYEYSILTYQEVLDYYLRKNMKLQIGRISGDMGYSYFIQGDHKNAEKLLRQATIILASNRIGIEYLPNIYGNLSNLLYDKGNYKDAFNYLMQYVVVQRELNTNNSTRELDKQAYISEQTKKEQEITSANQAIKFEEEKSKRIIGYAIAIAVFAGLMTLFFLWKRKQKKQVDRLNVQLEQKHHEEKLKNKEISALNKTLESRNQEIADLKEEESHRTGNTYNKVIEKLREQIEDSNSIETKKVLNQSLSIVQTSATIHEMLKENKASVNEVIINHHFKQLCHDLQKLYFPSGSLNFSVRCENSVKLNNRVAQKIFFIVNELITNASKHAFVNQVNPKIIINLFNSNDKNLILTYSDNGVGLPEKTILDSKIGQGLEIINGYTKSLNGSLEIEKSEGTSFRFNFNNIVKTENT